MPTEKKAEARAERATFRLTEEEFAILRRAAAADRRPFSQWLRLVTLDAAAAVLARAELAPTPTPKPRSRKG